mgnify:CR=1 FL=1
MLKVDITYQLTPDREYVQAIEAKVPCGHDVHIIVARPGAVSVSNYHEEYGQPPRNEQEAVVKLFGATKKLPTCYRLRLAVVGDKGWGKNVLTAADCIQILSGDQVMTMAMVYDKMRALYVCDSLPRWNQATRKGFMAR